jgi:PKD repeat protein
MMRKTILSLAFSVISFWTMAQCISTFPHREDFENATTLQTISSCDATVIGDTTASWKQDTTDDGDWRADSSGTPSIGTGPGSTFNTSGVGIGTDYNPGTTSGIYLYTEASSATGCNGSDIGLISPCFDFSGSAFYRLKFAYHMYGSAMGVLHIDVWDSNVWVNDVYEIYNENELTWQIAEVPLFQYNKSETRIRIRMTMGNGFTSDCAIDDLIVEQYTPVDFDLEIFRTRVFPDEYFFFPLEHADSMNVLTFARNIGTDSLTEARAVANINSWTDSSASYTMGPLDDQIMIVESKYLPKSMDDTAIQVTLKVKETEANLNNNTGSSPIIITDSTYGRDNGTFTGSVGFNTGNGEIGTMLELKQDDTLTSVSFLILDPIAGDSLKVHLYEFGTTPGNLIESTDAIATGNITQWYTIKFNCPQVLKKGRYFVAVEQMTTNSNMGLAYSGPLYRNNVSFFNGGAGWTELGAGGITGLTLVHMHFGIPSLPTASITAQDSVCDRNSITVRGKGALKGTWGPDGFFNNKNSFVTSTGIITRDTNIYLVVEDNCGFKDTAWHNITVKPLPNAVVSNDTTICKFEPATLTVKTSSQNTYTWDNGSKNQSFTFTGASDKLVRVEIDSSNGCALEKSIQITVSKPNISATPDTTVCERNLLVLKAQGAPEYQWINGPKTSSYSIYPAQSQDYSVVGILANGCTDTATVKVVVTPGPDLKVTSDTSICFGDNVTLTATGADTYEWSDGPNTADWSFRPLFTKDYIVTAKVQNGCSLSDTVNVQVVRSPALKVSNDTTICEKGTATLTATAAADVDLKWSTNETTKTITVSPSMEETYYVSATNPTGCEVDDSIKVQVDPLPVISITHSLADKNLTVTSSSLHAESHLWDFGDGNTSNVKNTGHTYAGDGDYTVKYTATNTCGSVDTSFNISIKTASIPGFAEGAVQVYPNPTSEGWQLIFVQEAAEGYSYSLYDGKGQVILTEAEDKGTHPKYIDAKSWAPGVYVLVLQVNGRTYQQKLVKH